MDDDAILDALTKVNIDVDALLLKQGLDTTIQTTVSNFSGGEKRKLLLLLKDADMTIDLVAPDKGAQ